MKLKKLLAVGLTLTMAAGMFAGCGNKDDGKSTSGSGDSGHVYYLNFKPEQDKDWQNLAKTYTKQTGVPVTVVTAAEGTYEETLQVEIAKSEAPTLFQVNGPVGLQNWKDYCLDLSGSDVYKNLISDDYALKNDDGVMGIAYVIESYGLITNTKLLEQAGYKVDDIKSFADLKKVAEDITARSDKLGFAAFSSAGLDSSSDWRFKTHLANLPIYFEYQDENVSSTDLPATIKGTYLDQYKAMFDLYINNSTCSPKELAAKTGDDSESEFLEGKAVFFQNGSWEYTNLVTDGGMSADEVTMIPIYIGVGDEATQGLCTGTENFWCVNSAADEKDIQATLDFMNWCVTSDEGTTAMADNMGFVIPFKDAKATENIFVRKNQELMDAGNTTVTWSFSTIPSEQWKDDLASALTAYAAGTGDWDAVQKAFVDGWAKEYQATNAN